MRTFLVFSLAIGLLVSLPAAGKVGVGVGLGRIAIDEPLRPGGIYRFPNLPVLNTGDEAGEYAVEVTYQSDQPELRPEASWFTFSPARFPLDPGQGQSVDVTLTVPTRALSGDYFAYLEAHPVTTQEGISISVAAATKTYFSVKSGTVLGAIVERVRSLFTTYSPVSYLVLSAAGLVGLILLLRRFFSLRVRLIRKK